MSGMAIEELRAEIDRIDSNGDYAPGNLRFVPRAIYQYL